ncbi:MAG: carboxylesterase family protein [Janthinobacterium lividum]
MLDQHAPLCWLQANIAFFSKDRSSLTIVGKSAGDGSVSIRVASPQASGPYSSTPSPRAGSRT